MNGNACTSRRGRCGGWCLACGRSGGADILVVTIQVQLPFHLKKKMCLEKREKSKSKSKSCAE